jgi:hypothetical protein
MMTTNTYADLAVQTCDPLHSRNYRKTILAPTSLQYGDCQYRQRDIVNQKYQCFIGVRIYEMNSSQRFLVTFERIKTGQYRGSTTEQTVRPIHRLRAATLDLQIRLGPYGKETARSVKSIESFEIEKSSVQDIVYAGLRKQLIENVDRVHLAIADMYKTRDIAYQTKTDLTHCN